MLMSTVLDYRIHYIHHLRIDIKNYIYIKKSIFTSSNLANIHRNNHLEEIFSLD